MPIAPKPNAPSPSRARHKGRASAGDDPPSGQDTRRPRLCSPTPLAPIALGSKLIGLGNTATQLLGAWSRAHLAEQEIGVRSTRFRSPTPTAISVPDRPSTSPSTPQTTSCPCSPAWRRSCPPSSPWMPRMPACHPTGAPSVRTSTLCQPQAPLAVQGNSTPPGQR